jgi:hypothetical protein
MSLVEFLDQTFRFDESTKIERVRQQMKRPRTSPKTKDKPLTKVGRHVVWDPNPHYILVRAGIPIRNEQAADALFKEDTITEAHFYLFCNKDAKVQRNSDVPVYEAAYFCTDTRYYIRVQKRYLKRAYTKLKRTNRTQSHEILSDGTPYWVDRHISCMMAKQQPKRAVSKKKDENI